MAVKELLFHLTNGEAVHATGKEATDFIKALESGEVYGEWMVFPINERTGFQMILHLTQVTHVDQLHDLTGEQYDIPESD